MSAQLTRLHALLGGELLVPSGRWMVRTPFADALAAELPQALDALLAVVAARRGFEPLVDARTWRVAGPDHVHLTVGLALARFAQEAPRVVLRLAPLSTADPESHLERGEADVVLSPWPLLPEGLTAVTLLTQPLAAIQRPGHPRGTGPLVVEDFARWPQVLAVPGPEDRPGPLDAAFVALGVVRRFAVTSPLPVLAPSLVASTDALAIVPERLARRAGGIEVFPLPFEADPLEVGVAWHPRTDRDPAQRWLRAVVRQVGASSSCGRGLRAERTPPAHRGPGPPAR